MSLSGLQYDFFNALNRLFDNRLPPNMQSIKIEASVHSPVIITAIYFPDAISGQSIESKFGLIEYERNENERSN